MPRFRTWQNHHRRPAVMSEVPARCAVVKVRKESHVFVIDIRCSTVAANHILSCTAGPRLADCLLTTSAQSALHRENIGQCRSSVHLWVDLASRRRSHSRLVLLDELRLLFSLEALLQVHRSRKALTQRNGNPRKSQYHAHMTLDVRLSCRDG